MSRNKLNMMILALGLLLAGDTGSLHAEGDEAAIDEKVRLEALEEAVEGLTRKTEELSMMYIEGFTDIRYDQENRPNQNAGLSGIFARRAEIKMSGNVVNIPTAVWSLGYDFAENKLKDLGVEIKDINLIPLLDVMPEYTWSLRIGQYRMPFGIVPQTSSSSIWFSERPMMYGGKGLTGTQVPATQLMKERVMGLQLRQKKFDGVLAYDLQLGAVNNASEDQAAGKNKIGAADALPSQVTDQDLSFMGRFAFSWDFLGGLLPEKSSIQTGVSYARDSQNNVWNAQNNANIMYDDVLGGEFSLALANKMITLDSEYIRYLDNIQSPGGANLAREGWYAAMGFDTMPLFRGDIPKGNALQILAGLDEQTNYAINTGSFGHKASRLSSGLKWSYGGGKNHTSINYFVTAPDQMFGGDGRAALDGGTGVKAPETLLIIQQQFAFETGKPK